MNKKIEVKQEELITEETLKLMERLIDLPVEVKVDFKMVWAFMWRWVVLVFGIAFCLGAITTMFG
jgi:hypothetical protein